MVHRIALTGASSYTGRYVINHLIKRLGPENFEIVNFSNRKHLLPEGFKKLKITSFPYDFQNKNNLIEAMLGCSLFICTYWVRFDNFRISRDEVTNNAKLLITCAKEAGVERCVYTSHTQTNVNSSIPYIAGKAEVENHVKEQFEGRCGILKPCTIFGDSPKESIVINNLAYLLRTFPVMPIVGDGKYPYHPVHVRDLARLCIEAGFDDHGLGEYDWDAVNPEKMDFIDLLTLTRDTIGAHCYLQTNIPKELAYFCTKPINWLNNDILIDPTDIDLLTNRITCSDKEPLGRIRYSDWIREYRLEVGRKYISSIERYYDR